MNTLTVAVFACVAVFASAKPSGLWGVHGHGHLPVVGASGVVSSNGAAGPAGIVTGHGAIGPNGIPNAVGHGGVIVGAHGLGLGLAHGHDDGQWHGEGLLASQDWAGHGAAIVAPGVVSAHGLGLGLGLGHGLIGGHGLGAVVAGPAGTIVSNGVHGHIGLGAHGW